MAVDAMKVTLNFSMAPLPGWSESFFYPATVINDVLIAKVDELCAKRIIPLVNVAQITSYRITAQPAQRLSRHFRKSDLVGKVTGLRDNANVGYDIPLLSTSGRLRSFAMHGLSDNTTQFRADGGENNHLDDDKIQFFTYLKTNSWQMRVTRTLATAAGLPVVKDITVAAGVVTINVVGAGLVPGQHFQLSGLKGFKVGQFRGEFVVDSYADPVLTFTTRRYIDPVFLYSKSTGKLRALASNRWVYENIADFLVNDFRSTTRKVGRPPDAPRGRQSAKR